MSRFVFDAGLAVRLLPIFMSSCRFGGVASIRAAICRVASSKSGFLTMTDDSSDELEITKAELGKATREFEIVYGAAIAEWSRLEGRLFYWFQLLTGMNEKIGDVTLDNPIYST